MFFVGLFCCSALIAQTQHFVTLNWTDTQNPTGTTYNVSRATGLCSVVTSFTQQNISAVTLMTYQDTGVTVGNYCYFVTAFNNGIESLPSNLADAKVLPFPPSKPTITIK